MNDMIAAEHGDAEALARAAKRISAKFAEAEQLCELSAKQRELYEKLVLLRRRLARTRSVAAYQILPNESLLKLCVELPLSPEAFSEIRGVGRRRQEAYSREFVGLIRKEVLGEDVGN